MKHFIDPLGVALFAPVFAPCHITLSARNTLAPRKETLP